MKQNFKIGDKVKSLKPGILNGIEGAILSIDTEKRKQLTVICGASGTWSFSFDEVEPLVKEKQSFKADVMPWEQTEKKDSIDNLTVATKPAKRSYNRKSDKAKKEVKPKRKYMKKSA